MASYNCFNDVKILVDHVKEQLSVVCGISKQCANGLQNVLYDSKFWSSQISCNNSNANIRDESIVILKEKLLKMQTLNKTKIKCLNEVLDLIDQIESKVNLYNTNFTIIEFKNVSIQTDRSVKLVPSQVPSSGSGIDLTNTTIKEPNVGINMSKGVKPMVASNKIINAPINKTSICAYNDDYPTSSCAVSSTTTVRDKIDMNLGVDMSICPNPTPTCDNKRTQLPIVPNNNASKGDNNNPSCSYVKDDIAYEPSQKGLVPHIGTIANTNLDRGGTNRIMKSDIALKNTETKDGMGLVPHIGTIANTNLDRGGTNRIMKSDIALKNTETKDGMGLVPHIGTIANTNLDRGGTNRIMKSDIALKNTETKDGMGLVPHIGTIANTNLDRGGTNRIMKSDIALKNTETKDGMGLVPHIGTIANTNLDRGGTNRIMKSDIALKNTETKDGMGSNIYIRSDPLKYGPLKKRIKEYIEHLEKPEELPRETRLPVIKYCKSNRFGASTCGGSSQKQQISDDRSDNHAFASSVTIKGDGLKCDLQEEICNQNPENASERSNNLDDTTGNLNHFSAPDTKINNRKRKRGERKRRKGRGARKFASVDITPMPEPIDPDEPNYCVCNQVSYGTMVKCDNDLCPIEWCHLLCVNLKSAPRGKWYCPLCRGCRSDNMKPKLEFYKVLTHYNKKKEAEAKAEAKKKKKKN